MVVTADSVEAAIADWRRKYRRTMLFKAARRVGLIILVCAGAAAWYYALHV